MLIESAVELLSYSSSYHLIDTNVTRTSDEIQKVSRIKKGEADSSPFQRVDKPSQIRTVRRCSRIYPPMLVLSKFQGFSITLKG
ncbi:hypothetical protein C7B63_12450 [Bacillus halotolerans]|nr:hypothetical protein C7B63_12450 [Bacillus halotolerans]PRP54596.1 hypothetical protein C7B71_12095 [Bacillus halotolerans]PRP58882.1 hypothetical protein C7B66_10980 [Bacillus halotolerans]PRP62747.1 hypothetical protein C7B72_15180 [Bacillus halotolerans]